jgi:GDP-4-dehydro-6-deoxy-D-mannose reductase
VRVLVTGAAGFVGRHLVPHLEAAGAAVIGVDREVDVTDRAAVHRAVSQARPDAIVHLAGQSATAGAGADEGLDFRVNYLGGLAVLEALALAAPGARLLFVGSGLVYGPAAPGAPPFAESSSLCPASPYERSKAAADLLAADYAERGLDVVRVRPFNHTGPGQSDAFVASAFARQIAEVERGQRPHVLRVGNLESARDFLDVRDVVDAYARLLARAVPAGVYNVASGRATPMGEILDGLLSFSPAANRIAVEADPARWRPTTATAGDASRLRAATGWAPRHPLPDTLERLLDDWRARLSA